MSKIIEVVLEYVNGKSELFEVESKGELEDMVLYGVLRDDTVRNMYVDDKKYVMKGCAKCGDVIMCRECSDKHRKTEAQKVRDSGRF